MEDVDRVFRSYYEDIFQYVYSLVQSFDIAEDITQETFIQIFEGAQTIPDKKSTTLRTQLMEIADELYAYYCKKIVSEGMNEALEELNHTNNYPTKGDPLHSIRSKEMKNVIQTAIKSLKKEHQLAVQLFDMEQHSYKESAAMLGMSEVAFASLLKRARRALVRELIKGVDPEIVKEPFSERELKKLVYWFDILDFPIDPEIEVALKSKGFFDGMNENFEAFRNDTYPEGLNEYLLSEVPLNKEDIVVDIGCGAGSLTFLISPHVSEVYAVDHSVEMLNALKETMEREQINNIKPILVDFSSQFTNPQEKFHVAFCCMVLHHLYDPKGALQKLAKSIVPGGHLIVADLAYTTENWKFKDDHDLWSGFKREQIGKWLKKAGFKIMKIEENHSRCFKFYDTKNEAERIHVPLLYAHCIRRK